MELEFKTVPEPFVALLEECVPLRTTLSIGSDVRTGMASFAPIGEEMRVPIETNLNNFDELRVRVHNVDDGKHVWVIGAKAGERKVLLGGNDTLDSEDLEYVRNLAVAALLPWWQQPGSLYVWAVTVACVVFAVGFPIHLNWNNTPPAGLRIFSIAVSAILILNAALLIRSTHKEWVGKVTKIRSALAALAELPSV